MAENFDLIVIGAGSGARDGASRASRDHGARVALIERVRWGGSCPNVACRPTKAYLVAAELTYTVNELSDWMGVRCGPAEVDLARVRAWKDSLRRTQESWVDVLTDAGYEVVPGEASFVDATTVRVGERELTAERILIATGSRTAVPRVPGIENVDWIDHISALELEQIPESLLVVGAGPVGLELAQIFARFGSRVTIVNHGPQIAARADTEAAAELHAARRLRRDADGDLHRPGARRRRTQRGGGASCRARRRCREASAPERHARAVHAYEARLLQARLRRRQPQGARRPRRLARCERHRRRPHAGLQARHDGRRPCVHAPHLSELCGGAQGGGGESAGVSSLRHVLRHGLAAPDSGPARRRADARGPRARSERRCPIRSVRGTSRRAVERGHRDPAGRTWPLSLLRGTRAPIRRARLCRRRDRLLRPQRRR